MARKFSPIISAEELKALKTTVDIVLIDARSGPDARQRYEQAHLDGALYVDMEKDLADVRANASVGGRHPLPATQAFVSLLGRLGVNPSSLVVVYDDKSGANAAARFWWMLKAIGHEKVCVLDGGYPAALAAAVPSSSDMPPVAKTTYKGAHEWLLPVAQIDEVAEAALDPHALVIDVREATRYNGEYEPIDLIAGHIPGAVNIPFSTNLNTEGKFLPPYELEKKYKTAFENTKPENIIVHCGSGVTACHTLLAMDYAGLPVPKLYVGSWSEWSRNERPMATNSDE